MTVATQGKIDRVGIMEGPQAEFVKSTARYPGLFAGRGFGKTTASVIKTFVYATSYPGCYGCATIPIWDGLEKFYLPTVRRLFGAGENRDWEWQEKKKQIVFPKLGSTIFLRPANEPDGLRGMTLAFASMDEIATENQYEAFTILQPAIRQKGYPNQLWVTSTPSDVKPWIKSLWVDKINPMSGKPLANADQFKVLHGKTVDNYHLPEWQRTELLAEYEGTRWYRQEYCGEFITVGGLAFPEFDRDVHVREAPSGTEFVKTVTGYDYGDTSPTSLITIKLDRYGKLWVTDEFYQRNSIDEDWIKWAGERNVSRIICDPSFSRDEQRRLGRVFGVHLRAAQSKRFDRRYKFWAGRLSVGASGPGIFISPSCRNLITEIENIAFKQPRGHEELVDEWAIGSSDHAYDAAAYAGMEFEGSAVKLPRYAVEYEGYN